MTVQEQFGQIDIYVFDQILRGNIAPGMRVLDAGCGFGRNLVHLLREGCEVFAIDANADGVDHVRRLAAMLAPRLPAEKYTYVSSRLIKGVFKLGGDVSELVPPLVMARMRAKVLTTAG